ncbi:MAG: argininosuccinate synthase [Cytophagales bacterium]|nr:argininosuccinate synthase [Cytophagales bacterium]
MENKKVVLAFSGGLDTTYCVKYLAEDLGLEVYSAIVNTGGFSEEELKDIEQKAIELGVKEHVILDETNVFYEKCVRYLIAGNVLKNNTYPLSVSAERVFQAMAIGAYAKKIGAGHIAHGSTGAGNDQVRFDMTFHIMCPDVKIITPIRDMQLSREAEIEYLKGKGVIREWSKAKYSINKGLWGTSVGGAETLTSHEYLPEEAWPTQVTKTGEETVEIEFKEGHPVAINGESFENPVAAIQKLEEITAPYGVGRDIHVGDTIIGIKGRVGFEAAAPTLLIKAHHALEKHVLTKVQLNMKDPLANTYGSMVHEGQFLEPAMRDMEQYLASTQDKVNGKVKIYLAPYRFHIVGIESGNDLMSNKFGSYGEMNNTWSGDDVKGFSKIFGNQTSIYFKVNEEEA